MIKLELDINAVNFILQTLGELPTKTGAWELVKVIKEQADPQAVIDTKASALAKLTALGLSEDEVKALVG